MTSTDKPSARNVPSKQEPAERDTPGTGAPDDHLSQQAAVQEVQDEAGIPTDLDRPLAPGGTVVQNPKGDAQPAERVQDKKDAEAG